MVIFLKLLIVIITILSRENLIKKKGKVIELRV